MGVVRDHWLREVAKERSRRSIGEDLWHRVPEINCADGTWYSVQASLAHYCTPKVTDMSCPYTAWEVLAYVDAEELADGEEVERLDGGGFIAKRVPTEIIEALIERHGG